MRARALAVVVAMVLAVTTACGGDDGDDATSSGTGTRAASTAAGSVTTAVGEGFDPAGVVRIAGELDEARGGLKLDPTQLVSSGSHHYLYPIYGSLLARAADGTWKPDLATDWEIVDPNTVELTLREGVAFHDGRAFDAEAVKVNLDRARQAPTGAMSTEVRSLTEVEVVDPLTVRLHLSEPVAGWLFTAERAFFGSAETLMASPAAIEAGTLGTSPVGAGPFRFVSYTPGAGMVVEKNPDYWNADQIKLAGIEWVYAADPTAALNALRGGQVDLVGGTTNEPVSELEAIPGLTVDAEVTGARLWSIYVCKSRPPFDDVRVRQALSYAVDRDAIVATAFEGLAAPMTGGTWPPGSRLHAAELDGRYVRDVDRARQLLAEAGASDVSFELVISPGSTQGARIAELVQSQAAEAGIDVEIVQSANIVQEFYIDGKYASAVTGGSDRGVVNLTPGGVGNVCRWDDPDLNRLAADIKAAAPGSDEEAEAWAAFQEKVVDEALIIWLAFGPEVNAWIEDRVGGVAYYPGDIGLRNYDYTSLYVKA